jgi:putative PEP-CTERM system histidine kinase
MILLQMNTLIVIEFAACIAGFVLSLMMLAMRRFGSRSGMLALFLLPSSIAAGVLGLNRLPFYISLRSSYSFLLIATVGGYAALSLFGENTGKSIRVRRIILLILACVAVLLFGSLHLDIQVTDFPGNLPEDCLALGPAGYISALFLIVVSVMSLANLEQILRSAEEALRWRLKFLILGMGISFCSIIYISSTVLLTPFRLSLVSSESMAFFSPMHLIACLFITISWYRSNKKTEISVSHGVIYSSITFLGVGLYLISSSLLARWASTWAFYGIPSEAFVFFLSVILLATLLLQTSIRHRIRYWMRRNLFGGRYDYRQFWMEATERVNSTDPPETFSKELADIICRALGAINVAVWIRKLNPNALQLLSTRGTITDIAGTEIEGVIEEIISISEPVSIHDLQASLKSHLTILFMERNSASFLLPLVSSGRTVGVVTIGPDRSGRPYGGEARSFLQVLGRHAASEIHKFELQATLVEAKEHEAFRAFSTFLLHDLKNFASTLSLIAQNAIRFQNNADFHKDAFKSIQETAEKMKRLCNSLHTFSNQLAEEKRPEDLNEIIKSVVGANKAFEHIHLELLPLPQVAVDRQEIAKVLQNLILNSQQAIRSDGSIWIRTAANTGTVQLIVRDNGRGMSKQFLKNDLFQPFRTTKTEGLGIGLFHTKRVLDSHNARIDVESEEGLGTTITVKFTAASIMSQSKLPVA